MSAYRVKKSPAHKLHLWRTRGHCPNRKELIRDLFKPVFDPHARPVWIMNFQMEKSLGIKPQVARLPYLYISESKKIFFIAPRKSGDEEIDEMSGYVLWLRRSGQDNAELDCGNLKLYPLYWEDINKYFPHISKKQYEQRTQTHPISRQELRFISGKWKSLLASKMELDDYYTFKFNGFTRLRFQTTGKVWGIWDESED